MVNVWLFSYLVHYKLNYSFLSQTKELRETNTMLDKWLRKVQVLIVMCHLREMVTWIHRKRITDLTAFHLWMVKYFDPLIPNICLCLLLLLWSSLFLATPPLKQNRAKAKTFLRNARQPEVRPLICLDAYNKFVLLNFFSLIETICPKIWAQPLPMNGKKFTSGWCPSLKNAFA